MRQIAFYVNLVKWTIYCRSPWHAMSNPMSLNAMILWRTGI